MELTEPTFPNLLVGIDKTMTPGVGFRMLIGTTRQGTRLLQDDPEEPLPLAEMIRITNSRLVRIWWSLNPPTSAKTDPASDPRALRPDASDVFSASHASCAS